MSIYVESLQHLCFAAVLADKISVSADVTRNRASEGGRRLFQKFGQIIEPIEEVFGVNQPGLKVEDVISESHPDLRGFVEADLLRVADAYLESSEVWKS